MTPTNIILMLAIPVGVVGIIAFILLAGPMKPTLRRRLEWFMILAFYPGMAIYFGWRSVQQAMEADWISAGLSAALACVLAWQGVVMARKQARTDGTRT
ncbi:hypothetical protein [Brevundimonas sp. TWP2-3-2]|uniref:hypothetical protein n=1 Tax=unclassified Brevundimonas TaxID=2622653 RepID=UPI003CF62CE5